jgi:hypothetical protein
MTGGVSLVNEPDERVHRGGQVPARRAMNGARNEDTPNKIAPSQCYSNAKEKGCQRVFASVTDSESRCCFP